MKHSRGERGFTLVELLVAIVLSSLVIFLLHKAFVAQHRTYGVQEQIFDLQQNTRAMTARMVREIRMAGFGRVAGEYVSGEGYVSRILPVQFTNTDGTTISYPNVLNRDQPVPGWLTIVSAVNSVRLSARLVGTSSRFEIAVDRVSYDSNRALFDEGNKRYISIDGVESNAITDIREETVNNTTRYHLTLQYPLEYNHRTNALVYPITAISFQVEGREEAGGSNQPIAENITWLTFEYFTTDGEPTENDRDIRMVRVAVTAETSKAVMGFRDSEGHLSRRPLARQMASNVQIRNLAFAP